MDFEISHNRAYYSRLEQIAISAKLGSNPSWRAKKKKSIAHYAVGLFFCYTSRTVEPQGLGVSRRIPPGVPKKKSIAHYAVGLFFVIPRISSQIFIQTLPKLKKSAAQNERLFFTSYTTSKLILIVKNPSLISAEILPPSFRVKSCAIASPSPDELFVLASSAL